MKTGVRVMDAMTKGLIDIKSGASIAECATKMIKKGVGGVLVVDAGVLKGMITEKDLVEKVVARGTNPMNVKVKEVMSKRIVSITPDADIYDALIKMRDEEVRRLPVIHKNKPVGLLTAKDILKIEPSLFDIIAEKMKIREARGKPLAIQGKCESCGAEKRLLNRDSRMLCDICREL